MAWKTKQPRTQFSSKPLEPDVEFLSHWVKGLWPLVQTKLEEEIIIIICNQTGTDGDATYAGTSAVLGIKSGEVLLHGLLGGGIKELLVVDTSKPPIGKLVFVEEEDAKVSDSADSDEAEPLTPDAPFEQSDPAQKDSTRYTIHGEGTPYKQDVVSGEGVSSFEVPPEPAAPGSKHARQNFPPSCSPSNSPKGILAGKGSTREASGLGRSALTNTARSPTASTPHPSKTHGDWRSYHARKSPGVSDFNEPPKGGPGELGRPISPKSRNVKAIIEPKLHNDQVDSEAAAILPRPGVMTTNLQPGRISRERRGRWREQRQRPKEDSPSSSRDSTRNGMLHRRVDHGNTGDVCHAGGRRSQSAGSQRLGGFSEATQSFMARSFGLGSSPVSKEELQRASVEIDERLLKRRR
ncbi:hypothetical protein LLEC1_02144 [Akanthomyces lecanii]|uniref:Uncharacterized protein n=1 Tax=Cordyceps confragosa TaxID=2714763 RepID=A0A179IE20_CORDF|nr:hypothetical protein LLEC1_02144 [Akanthomyces lecanii]